MAQHKGRIIKPETTFIDHVAINLDEESGPASHHGHLELPVGAAVRIGETYRMELYDGRAGEVRITAYNDISNVAQFQVVSELR